MTYNDQVDDDYDNHTEKFHCFPPLLWSDVFRRLWNSSEYLELPTIDGQKPYKKTTLGPTQLNFHWISNGKSLLCLTLGVHLE